MNSLVLGQDNKAGVNQNGDNQDALITQVQQNNEARIYQNSDKSFKQKADIYQEGKGNLAIINQDKSGSGADLNLSTVQQVGENNQVFQRQITPDGSSGHRTTVEQKGKLNYSDQLSNGGTSIHQKSTQIGHITSGQGGQGNHGGNGESHDENEGDHLSNEDPEGGGHRAVQSSLGGFLVDQQISQKGSGHEAYQNTEYGYESRAKIEMHGRTSFASQYQEGQHQWADILQHGNSNYADQKQWGGGPSYNMLSVDQHGSSNESYQVQDGIGNRSYVVQKGQSYRADTRQTGNSNQAHVNQK